MNSTNRYSEERQEVQVVDDLGPVYQNNVKRILTSDDKFYYSKGGVWVPLSAASTPSVVVRKNSGADVGTRPRVNLIEGSNITLTVADDGGSNEVDVTIAASGGGSGNATYKAAYASRPAAGTDGDLFFPTDSYFVERDTGSVWESWGSISKYTPPVDGDFAWVNQGSAAVTTTNGGVYLSGPTNGSAHNFRIRKKALASAPYNFILAIRPLFHYQNYSQMGIGLRESGSGKLVVVRISNENGGWMFAYEKWDSPSAFNSAYISFQSMNIMPRFPEVYLRIQDDNTNRKLYWGASLNNWIELHSVSRTDFITPDESFFAVNPFSQDTGMLVLHYSN